MSRKYRNWKENGLQTEADSASEKERQRAKFQGERGFDGLQQHINDLTQTLQHREQLHQEIAQWERDRQVCNGSIRLESEFTKRATMEGGRISLAEQIGVNLESNRQERKRQRR